MEDKSVVDCTLSNNIWWSRAHILIFGVLQVYSRWLLATSFCSDFDVYNGHMALCSCSPVQIWAPEQSVKQLCGRVENKVKSCQAARNRLSILWACARHPTYTPSLGRKSTFHPFSSCDYLNKVLADQQDRNNRTVALPICGAKGIQGIPMRGALWIQR